MELKGSCHCQAVKFTVQSSHPYPFNLCYCEICRKTAGSGGYAININALHDTLAVTGTESIKIYQAEIADPDTGKTTQSPAQRSFCGTCGSALWLWDPRWPAQVHPQASAIDTALPTPPERTHLMLASKAPWTDPLIAAQDKCFDQYPDESIADWHKRLGLEK